MCTAGERHAAAAAACCCLFCVTPGFPLPCTVYFELTLSMGLISMTFHLRAFFTCFAIGNTGIAKFDATTNTAHSAPIAKCPDSVASTRVAIAASTSTEP